MKDSNPLEKVIEQHVCARAQKLGIMHYKFISPSKRSVPDRIFILPGGAVFWIEFKRRGEHPTPAQCAEISKLQKQGATVYVVDHIAVGKQIIEKEYYLYGNVKKDVLTHTADCQLGNNHKDCPACQDLSSY